MNLSRRHQVLPPYAYCRDCRWTDTGTSRGVTQAVEAEASAHHSGTGHEVRSVTSRQTIFTLPKETVR
jgi:hypothetical protein